MGIGADVEKKRMKKSRNERRKEGNGKNGLPMVSDMSLGKEEREKWRGLEKRKEIRTALKQMETVQKEES